MSGRRLAPLVVLLALAAGAVGVARATTGNTAGFPPPKQVVPAEIADPFEGRYVVTEVGRGANVRSGEMKIELSDNGKGPAFLVGGLQLYEYGSAGQLEIGLFSLYPFSAVSGGVSAPLLSQGVLQTTLGQLKLLSPRDETGLRGELSQHGSPPAPIVFKRLGENQSVNGSPPPAKQLKETDEEPDAPGWGASAAEYEGEYELTDAAPDPAKEAAILAPVIVVAQGFGPGGVPVSGGTMTVSGGDSPSAELILEAGGVSSTYFLTDLAWRGDQRVAKVRGGSSSGPVVGSFEGRQSGDALKGTLEAEGVRYDLSFAHRG
ncbi:MAG: hypothetical protein JST31_03945 [Actinobacteria bacterium]|nr:hypothetical protein [Actinomycetota bacterium]